MVLRVKPMPSRLPINSLYTPVDNTLLHSISSVCHPRCCFVRRVVGLAGSPSVTTSTAPPPVWLRGISAEGCGEGNLYCFRAANYSRTSDLSGHHKAPKLKDEQHLRRNSQLTLDTTINDFNSGQFKTRMKKMDAQVDFYLNRNAILSHDLFGAWKLAHICPIKVSLTYLYWVCDAREVDDGVLMRIQVETTAYFFLNFISQCRLKCSVQVANYNAWNNIN